MKKKLILPLVGIFIVVLGVIGIFVLNKTSIEERYVFYENYDGFGIKLFKSNEEYTLVIPSFWDEDSVKYRNIESHDVDERLLTTILDTTSNSLNKDVIDKDLYNLSRGGQFSVYKSKIATIMINTDNISLLQLNKNKQCEDRGEILVVDSTGKVSYCGSFESIHGRGNSTWNAAKKPYNIKLSEKASLLGLKPMKSFCLLANSFDHSNLRNYIAYKTALEFGTASPVDCEFVSLYINGNYLGVYLLTTKPGINKNSVNINDLGKTTKKLNYSIDYSVWEEGFGKGAIKGSLSADVGAKKGVTGWKDPKDITGGYIIEATGHISSFNEKPSGFVSANNIPISIREPKYATKNQVEYISALYDEIELAVGSQDGFNHKTGNHYSDYIDVESFVKYYLIQETFLTIGPGLGSFKMYKDSDCGEMNKLVAGPIWDFDNSMANADIEFMQIPDVLYALQGIANHPNHYKGLLAELMKHEQSLSDARNLFNTQLKPILEKWFIGGLYEETLNRISYDSYLNEKRWPVTNGKAYSEDVVRIKAFMTERIKALSDFWGADDDYINHCVSIDAGFYECGGTYNTMSFYVPEVVFSPPQLSSYYGSGKPYKFEGVYYKGMNKEYKPTIINQFTELEYRWKEEKRK